MKRNLVIICIAATAFTGCQKHETVAAAQPTAVKTITVEIARESHDVRYSGIVAADTQVDLAFRVAGYVEQIGNGREVQEGDYVAAGTVLARLRPSEYQTKVNYAQSVSADAAASLSALQAQLSDTDAALVQATRDYERARTLFGEKAMTRADFDAVEARFNSATAKKASVGAQIAAQQARMEGAGAQQRDAAISLNDTSLVAPFPGVIVSKRIARGSFVGSGTPAFTIADTRVAKVSFGVPDLALRAFKPGDALRVSAEALPEREFHGRVTTIGAAADPTSRTFTVDVSIPNGGRELKVGMVATVVVPGAQDEKPVPSIPLTAVVKAQGGYGVYLVERGSVHLQPVTLGPVRGNAVLVTAGLAPGQRVVATGGLQLASGEKITEIP